MLNIEEIKARTETAREEGFDLQQFDDLDELIAEVEDLNEQHRCDVHNVKAMQATLDQQAKNCEKLLLDDKQQIATLEKENVAYEKIIDELKPNAVLKKALELACRYHNFDDFGTIRSEMDFFIHQAREQSCHTCQKVTGCPHRRFEPNDFEPCAEYLAQE